MPTQDRSHVVTSPTYWNLKTEVVSIRLCIVDSTQSSSYPSSILFILGSGKIPERQVQLSTPIWVIENLIHHPLCHWASRRKHYVFFGCLNKEYRATEAMKGDGKRGCNPDQRRLLPPWDWLPFPKYRFINPVTQQKFAQLDFYSTP